MDELRDRHVRQQAWRGRRAGEGTRGVHVGYSEESDFAASRSAGDKQPKR